MKINKTQKYILILYTIVILIFCIYVPYAGYTNKGNPTGLDGYYFIWDNGIGSDSPSFWSRIDYKRIILEIFGISIFMLMLFAIFKNRKERGD